MQPTDKATTTTPPDANRHVRELVQSVLRGSLSAFSAGGSASPQSLRQSLRAVCDYAKERGLRAEQLLIIVKQSWDHLEETHFLERRDAQGTLSEVITLCIKEYYRIGQPS